MSENSITNAPTSATLPNNAQPITRDCVVEAHYHLCADGQKVESTFNDAPIVYLQGHGDMIRGFEQALEHRTAGAELTFEVAPEQGYGPRLPGKEQRVPVKHLIGQTAGVPVKKWRSGMVAAVLTEQGQEQVTVVKAGRFMADIDTNHPLAGKSLRFRVAVVSVRKATVGELAHGHVHRNGHCANERP